MAALKKPVPFGKYYLLERINVGGMAEVFKAKAFGVEGFERLARGQAHPAEHRGGRRVHHDVHRRGEDRRAAAAREHRPDLRPRRGRRQLTSSRSSTSTARTCARSSTAAQQAARRCRSRMACYVIDAGLRGARLRAQQARRAGARAAPRPPRRLAAERPRRRTRARSSSSTSASPRRRARRRRRRPASSRASSATCRPSRCAGCRSIARSDIFARRHRALRAAHRRAAVRRRERLLDAREGAQRRDPAAVDVQPEDPATSSSASCSRRWRKDADDRYQNAIDLHDDLQAFLYTAGEFYSRKDLAAWMKKTFAMEIEEETAKLEEYRQVAPPVAARRRGVAPRRRRRGAARARRARPRRADAAKAPPPKGNQRTRPSGHQAMGWDDEELDTQIFDKEEVKPVAGRGPVLRGRRPHGRQRAGARHPRAGAAARAADDAEAGAC